MNVPKEGQGLHDWLLTTSRNLLLEGYSTEESIKMLVDNIDVRTTQDPETEVRNVVEGAAAWLAEHPDYAFGRRYKRSIIGPAVLWDWTTKDPFEWKDGRSYYLPVDQKVRKKALAAKRLDSYGKYDLGDLFARVDFLVCFAKEVNRPQIIRLSGLVKVAEQQQFIISTYCLTSIRGKCDDNMGKALYQVVEFDQDTKEDQWKLLCWLDNKVRLAMIVDSGHKSLHGWFPVYHLGRREVKSFFRLATSIGCDKHLWVASQYVRMPEGLNQKTNHRQKVVYWNQQVVEEHNEIVRRYCANEQKGN